VHKKRKKLQRSQHGQSFPKKSHSFWNKPRPIETIGKKRSKRVLGVRGVRTNKTPPGEKENVGGKENQARRGWQFLSEKWRRADGGGLKDKKKSFIKKDRWESQLKREEQG